MTVHTVVIKQYIVRGVHISFSWGGVVSKLDRLTDQKTDSRLTLIQPKFVK